MKIETTHGEAREVIVDQIGAVIEMLKKVKDLSESGQNQMAYKDCDFDLINRMTTNLEAWVQ